MSLVWDVVTRMVLALAGRTLDAHIWDTLTLVAQVVGPWWVSYRCRAGWLALHFRLCTNIDDLLGFESNPVSSRFHGGKMGDHEQLALRTASYKIATEGANGHLLVSSPSVENDATPTAITSHRVDVSLHGAHTVDTTARPNTVCDTHATLSSSGMDVDPQASWTTDNLATNREVTVKKQIRHADAAGVAAASGSATVTACHMGKRPISLGVSALSKESGDKKTLSTAFALRVEMATGIPRYSSVQGLFVTAAVYNKGHMLGAMRRTQPTPPASRLGWNTLLDFDFGCDQIPSEAILSLGLGGTVLSGLHMDPEEQPLYWGNVLLNGFSDHILTVALWPVVQHKGILNPYGTAAPNPSSDAPHLIVHCMEVGRRFFS